MPHNSMAFAFLHFACYNILHGRSNVRLFYLNYRSERGVADMVKIIIVWVLAGLFTTNGIYLLLRTNYNSGVLITCAFAVIFIVYGLFHNFIDEFCMRGFGLFLKVCFFIGLGIFAALFAFVALSGYSQSANGNERAYIVLGAGLQGEEAGGVLRRRLEQALGAWQQNQSAFIVVTGGQGPQELVAEAVAMQRWLVERGVPEDRILVESQSTSTEQNLAFAKDILAEHGVSADSPIAIVTNAFHCYRAGVYAQKLGFEQVSTVPASMSILTLFSSYSREVLAIIYMWVFRAGPLTTA